MHQSIKLGMMGGALLSAGLFVTTTPVWAAIVTGSLSIYANPFDVNNDGVVSGGEATMTAGAIGAGTVGVAGGYSQSDLVNRHDSYSSGNARLADGTGVATSGFLQYQAAAAFNAGTVISYQFVHPGFFSPMPVAVKLDGTTVQTRPGTLGSQSINVTTFSSQLTNLSTLRAEIGMTTFGGPTGTTYADLYEVLVLPQRLDRLTATVTQTAGTPWFNSPSAVSDLDGYGWGGFSNPSLKLTFAQPTNISALVVANFDSSGGPVNFNIKNDAGTVIGNVQMAGGAYGEFTPIRLNTPVLTSFLTFDFTDVSGGRSAMREIMVFTDAIPEPSTALLFGMGGLLLWRKIRKI